MEKETKNLRTRFWLIIFLALIIPFIKVEAQETVTKTVTETYAFITITVAERTIIDIKHNTTITTTELVELTWTRIVTNSKTETTTIIEEPDFLSPQVIILFGSVTIVGALALIANRRR